MITKRCALELWRNRGPRWVVRVEDSHLVAGSQMDNLALNEGSLADATAGQ